MSRVTHYIRADQRPDIPDDEDGNAILPRGVALDEIGPLELDPAQIDAEGNVTVPAVMDTRYHANLYIRRGVPIPEWAQPHIIDAPDNPRRKLA